MKGATGNFRIFILIKYIIFVMIFTIYKLFAVAKGTATEESVKVHLEESDEMSTRKGNES